MRQWCLNWTVKKAFDFDRQRGVEWTAQAKAKRRTVLTASGDSQVPCGWTLGEDWWKRTQESPADMRVEGLKYKAEEFGESEFVSRRISWKWMTVTVREQDSLKALCSGSDYSAGRENTWHSPWWEKEKTKNQNSLKSLFVLAGAVQWCRNHWLSSNCISYNKLKMRSTNS